MSGIVIFDTKFGNTEKVARSLTAGLSRSGVSVKCVGTKEVRPDSLKQYDLIVMGAPTQTFTASEPMKEFIDKLEGVVGLAGKKCYAFDTKLPSRFSGSAAKYIESRLEHMGLRPIGTRASAIGRGSVFALDSGEEARFEQIGFELGANLLRKD